MRLFSSLLVVFVLGAASFADAQCRSERYLDALPAPKATDVLFPLPSSVAHGGDTLYIAPQDFTFAMVGAKSALVDRAIERYKRIIFTLVEVRPGRIAANSTLEGIDLNVASDNETLQYGIDESYKLTVSLPRAKLSAKTPYGALRALETFSQLVQYSSDSTVVKNAPWDITDVPRYMHRGLVIDTSRHYLSVNSIYRLIDGLSYAKLNVLHWHMVDAQSFPVVSESFPKLTDAKYSAEEVYTKNAIQAIILYAKDRGVRVVAEVDTPGHTASWGVGYPEITVCRDKTREAGYCAENPCGELDPSKNKTYEVLSGFLNEMMDLFPDNFFHFGADEVVFKCWNTNDILAWMKTNGISDFAGVLNYFESKIFALAKARNKQPVHWQEVFEENVTLPANSIIQVWKDFATLDTVVKAGYRAILANYGAWYLDCGFGNWCPYCTWIDMYKNDPLNGSKLTPSQQALILGGEAAIWGELADEWNVDSRVWPRTAAVAERLWSPQTTTDIGDAMTRLLRNSCRLAHRDIHADPLIPGSTHKACIYIQE